MTNFETILFEKQRRGVLITLNRPALRNALNRQMKDELRAALVLARDDDAIRAVVLTGGGWVFSSGDDMNESLAGCAERGVALWHCRRQRLGGCL